jgi:hypothetical protein
MHAVRLSQRDTSKKYTADSQKPMSQQEKATKLMKQFCATGSVADKKMGVHALKY